MATVGGLFKLAATLHALPQTCASTSPHQSLARTEETELSCAMPSPDGTTSSWRPHPSPPQVQADATVTEETEETQDPSSHNGP